MPTILCYGDSNTHGSPPAPLPDGATRYGPGMRWPGVLRAALPGWTVIEEGLPGRTTVHDDPIEGAARNGLTYLVPCLESHAPLDVVAVMLGTNDLKQRFALAAEDIAEGVGLLLAAIARSGIGPGGAAPAALVIAPTPIGPEERLAYPFAGGAERSRRFGALYAAVAARHGAAFLDGGSVIRPSAADGVHLDPEAHAALGRAVAARLPLDPRARQG